MSENDLDNLISVGILRTEADKYIFLNAVIT